MGMFRTFKTVVAMVLTMVFAMGCNKPEEPIGDDNPVENDSVVDDNGTVNGHGYVDLGLPSGLLWATCNVGADTPEGCGEYFAWGETLPKDHYDWKSYRYGNFFDDRFEMTKYCSDSTWGLNGFVDTLTVLELVDDAARVQWGADWRMGYRGKNGRNWYQNTTFTWTTLNGVDGRMLSGNNGNSIFLPAAGFGLDDEFLCPGLGIYWSSSLHTNFPERGWSYHFDFESSHVCGTYERSRGQVVRAVRSVR
jgi:hypothetical protein